MAFLCDVFRAAAAVPRRERLAPRADVSFNAGPRTAPRVVLRWQPRARGHIAVELLLQLLLRLPRRCEVHHNAAACTSLSCRTFTRLLCRTLSRGVGGAGCVPCLLLIAAWRVALYPFSRFHPEPVSLPHCSCACRRGPRPASMPTSHAAAAANSSRPVSGATASRVHQQSGPSRRVARLSCDIVVALSSQPPPSSLSWLSPHRTPRSSFFPLHQIS